MNIDSTFEKKIEAASKHVSQFEPSISKYRATCDSSSLEKLKEMYWKVHEKKDGHYVESFRFATGFNQK